MIKHAPEHEHEAKNGPTTRPTHEQVAEKAYAIYIEEGRPQGHAPENWSEAEAQLQHAGTDHRDHHAHHDHHAHMAADFRKRFWISLVLTLPILVLSPMLQTLVGLREAIRFPGDIYVLFGLSSAVFWYGGWPFLKGFFEELKSRRPGDDDAGRRRHRHRVPLQQRRGIRPDRQDVLLGAGHPCRHHALGALDRDEIGNGCLKGSGGTGQAHALRRA